MIGSPSDIPLTWLMLMHRKSRLVLSIGGIAFAVLLMFMQLGFLTGLFDSQTLTIRLFDADVIIANRIRHNLHVEESFRRNRLDQATDDPDVVEATGVRLGNGYWRNPSDGRDYLVRIIGVDPDRKTFTEESIVEAIPRLREPKTILFDAGSRTFIEPTAVGTFVEFSGRRAKMAGTFHLGADFKNDGTVITSLETFRDFLPYLPVDEVCVGLVRIRDGADANEVASRLADRLPRDVAVYTLDEYVELENTFWSKMTPTGFIFTLGLVVGFVIGIMICYQILYNEINDHLPQFATLKAVGFPDRFLVSVVIKEALLLAMLGLVPGILASQGFYLVMARLSGLHMEMQPLRMLMVAGLTVLMCLISALFAIGRVLRTDPAEVF